jgi:hypothetical protein
MRTCKVSDQLYEQLKSFVVDPFDDTPEAVIGRLIEIVNKAKNRWSPFVEEEEEVPSDQGQRERQPMFQPRQAREEDEVVVL